MRTTACPACGETGLSLWARVNASLLFPAICRRCGARFVQPFWWTLLISLVFTPLLVLACVEALRRMSSVPLWIFGVLWLGSVFVGALWIPPARRN